jgi:hypothetical protein
VCLVNESVLLKLLLEDNLFAGIEYKCKFAGIHRTRDVVKDV